MKSPVPSRATSKARKGSEGDTPVELMETDAAAYERLVLLREPFLKRARDNALLTIPALMPPEGHNGTQDLHRPWISMGADGVNTLSSKLLMTVLPPNSPMFRLAAADKVVEELDGIGSRAEVEKKLNQVERSVQLEIEDIGVRAALSEGLKQLINSGNVLLYLPKTGNLRTFRLDRYVVLRDSAGNLLKTIIKETVSIETLPADVREMVRALKEIEDIAGTPETPEVKEVDVYTVFHRVAERIEMYQSVKGRKLPGSMGSWLVEKSPVMALRWNYLHDEDYGRSYVEEYAGDLMAAEALSKNLREAAAAAAKINPMVNPTGLTRAQDIAKSKNLEVISGRKDDVTMLQFDKAPDLMFVERVLDKVLQRLQYAFMMNRAAQRDAERVTAEEVRSVISDVDAVLGGIYSLLAQDLQRPLVVRVMDRMVREKKIPDLSKLKGSKGQPVVAPRIITGVDALGRGQDYSKYRTIVTEILMPLGPAAFAEVNLNDFLRRAFVSLSIDTDGLLKSPEDKQVDQQKMQGAQQAQGNQEMMQNLVKGATPHVAKAMSEGIDPSMLEGMADV